MTKAAATFLDLFYDNLRPLRFITIPLCMFAAIGLLLRETPQPLSQLDRVVTLMPDFVWALLFVVVALSRLSGILLRVNRWPTLVTPVLSIWLWSLLLFVGEAVPPTSPMSLLYLIPIAIEFWILAQYLDEVRRGCHDR